MSQDKINPSTAAAEPSEPIEPTKPTMSTWAFVWALIWRKPIPYFGYGIAWGLFNLIYLIPGLIEKRIFDTLTGDAPAGLSVWTLLAIFITAEVVRVLARYGTTLSDMFFQEPLRALLQLNLMQSVLNKPGASPLPISTGEAISRFGDDVGEVKDFPVWLPDMFGKLIFAVAALIVMTRISPLLTIIAVLPGILGLIIARRFWDRLQVAYDVNARARDAVSGFLGEIFGAVQAIKVADAEQDVIKTFRQINDNRRVAQLKETLYHLLSYSSGDTALLGIGAVLLIAGIGIRNETFTVGDFALFMAYIWEITWFFADCGSFVGDYKVQSVSLGRLEELAGGPTQSQLLPDRPVYVTEPPPPIPVPVKQDGDRLQELTIQGLSYRFPSSGMGISDINLSLPSGSFTVITGRVGAGKSTLLRVLLGLLPRDDGSILWNGLDVDDPGHFFRPPRSAYTPQVPRLYSESLRNNILMGLPEAEHFDLTEAIHGAVLEPDIAELEDGLETIVGPRGVKLSGGQVQRAATARMLVRQAQLLLVDDLSSALDVETEQTLWERFDEQQQDTTCLVVSHRRAALQRADQILVLKNGQVDGCGTLDELLHSNVEMQRLWHGEKQES
ncbi:MAG: ABC transporter ATP-binding protein [Chloroflexota bacterium]